MEKITTLADLKRAIEELELKQANEWSVLKEQFRETYDSFKPVNIIKNTLKDIINTPNLKNDILNTTLSLAAGYLTKRAVVGAAKSPVKQFLGILLQMGVTSLVSKNGDGLKSAGSDLLKNLFGKKSSPE